ncbi:rab-GTPase-TBC domain-containing protein [Panaeolus papilionaceus]|nr:rab-GTPase-TBC domain-containing protein [Panaeolus papilionaceus]
MATGETSVHMSDKTKDKKERLDWDALRQQSLRPGGFGDDRVNIWPRLLHVPRDHIAPKEDATKEDSTEPQPEQSHQDERQISLDTDRSFVLYPVDSSYDRETLQAALHKLLVQLFRQRPKLSYFQGYHDIVTVIFLTLPPELHVACVEKLSLHRLRDSMGAGLEPVLGLLRVTKNILRLADPEYSALLEENAQLPFYALSNLLTLFSHDMPTLSLIQHVFDYLLCRPPIAVVYLATAFILVRKQEALRLAEEDEEGMIHSLLSSLPNLQDDPSHTGQESCMSASPNVHPTEEEVSLLKEEPVEDDKSLLSALALDTSPAAVENSLLTHTSGDDSKATGDDVSRQTSTSVKLEESPPHSRIDESEKIGEEDVIHQPSLAKTPPDDVPAVLKEEQHEEESGRDHSSKHKPAHLFLTDLLKRADELYQSFPPGHPSVSLSSIMGPQSVVFTWSERSSSLPSDNTAEAMVLRPELVVYPYVPEPDPDREISKEATEKGKEDRKRRNKLKKSPFGQMERKTMLAGTVLVLGVAMAVYGIKARNATGHPLFVEGHNHPTTKDVKRLSGWIGGALIGVSSKLLGTVTSES